MYPLTHLYVTKNVLSRLSPALALGSILPDILTSVGMNWKEAHSQKDIPHKEMLLGNLIHGISLPGLDYYSDCAFGEKEGFAFQYASNLAQDLTVLGIPKEHALWRGHNFIEMAIEVNLNQSENELWQELDVAANYDQLKSVVYDLLDRYDYKEKELVNLVLERFLNIRGQLDRLAEDYAKKLSSIYQIQIKNESCQKLILKSQDLINDYYNVFLEKCCRKIEQDISSYI